MFRLLLLAGRRLSGRCWCGMVCSIVSFGLCDCSVKLALLCVACYLQTNNPRKMDVLTQLGVKITGRIPCQVQAGQYNEVGS